MTQEIIDYARELKRLGIPSNVVRQTEEILSLVPTLVDQLDDPTVEFEKKRDIIDRVFPEEIRGFLKLLIADNYIAKFFDIAAAYDEMLHESTEALLATLSYVTAPTEKQVKGIEDYLKKRFKTDKLELVMHRDDSIGGGFRINVGNQEIDWSTKGRVAQLEQRMRSRLLASNEKESDVISIIRDEIANFDLTAKDREVGIVKWVGDGIVRIDGIDHAEYGEIILFDSGVKGMVQDIRRNEIGCILFGSDDDIEEGSKVVRTGKAAGIPVGEGFLGRVVNALGAPIDGKGAIDADDYYPVERKAPGIVERKSVSVPMETGILTIDSMFPIGRGQRELIIGDRQTGKTSIATDTILNQKGKNVVCVYVAIGQKASSVAQTVNMFREKGAMPYTIVVAATASEPASLQYISPYAGTALAEYFMSRGQDVLIIYDDLSKHAVAYRAISLLLERSPGREAYPGDVFYLHSRLLERSSRLNKEAGGGSITALPIIETQAGDVSAYIPTNVISITDGQIFLETDLFHSGQRPAVNVGLSVSRVGGAAQTKAMKKAAGSLRIDLAQFREMEVFTQFSSDLDDTTKEQLVYGKGLMELLKQPLGDPMSLWQQVVTLVAATNRRFLKVPVAQIKEIQKEMLDYVNTSRPDIVSQIMTVKILDDSLRDQILQAVDAYFVSVGKTAPDDFD